MKTTYVILFSLILLSSNAQSINQYNNFLQHNNQVLFVKTLSDSSIHGNMFLYERKNNHKKWKLKDSFIVVVGKNGLAKDETSSISFNNTLPIKHEGDEKSPSGIFSIGPVFSYHNLKHLHMPFVEVDTNFYCVDDISSSHYNTLIKADTAKHDYNSFEYMRRKDNLYEYGIWVKYNTDDIKAGNGSCIFIHVRHDDNSGTAGCTAMTRQNILKLIYWLNEKKNPVVLQVVQTKKAGS